MTLRVALAYLAEQSASAQYRCKFLGEVGRGRGGDQGAKEGGGVKTKVMQGRDL